MQSRGQRVLTAVVALLIGLFTTSLNAHADTYEFFGLGNDATGGSFISVYGITDSGAVVLLQTFHAGVPQCANSGICTEYETFVNGVMVSESATPPNLVYDNGTPCVPTTSFPATAAGAGVCNNGHEVYAATPAITGSPTYGSWAYFDGPDITDAFSYAPTSVDEVVLNSSGDFAFDESLPNGYPGLLVEALDLTTTPTPEPGSIILLGTGLLAAGTLRRRFFLSAKS